MRIIRDCNWSVSGLRDPLMVLYYFNLNDVLFIQLTIYIFILAHPQSLQIIIFSSPTTSLNAIIDHTPPLCAYY